MSSSLFLSLFSTLDGEWGNAVTVLEFPNFRSVFRAKKSHPPSGRPVLPGTSPNLVCPGSSGPIPGPQAEHPHVFPLPLLGCGSSPLGSSDAHLQLPSSCRVLCKHRCPISLQRVCFTRGNLGFGSVKAPPGQFGLRTSALVHYASAHPHLLRVALQTLVDLEGPLSVAGILLPTVKNVSQRATKASDWKFPLIEKITAEQAGCI